MTRAITIFIILLLIMFAFLFLRDFKSVSRQKNPIEKTEIPEKHLDSNLQAEGESSANLHNWREFTSLKKNFKIFLPALPQHLADKVPDPATGEIRKYDTYLAAGDNGTAFMVNTITLSHKLDLKKADEALKNVVDEIISRNKANKLNEAKPGKFREYPALDFSINSNDTVITGKVFTDGNTIYILSMIAEPSRVKNDDMALFVNSFELLDGNKTFKP